MKKNILIITALASALILASCGSDGHDSRHGVNTELAISPSVAEMDGQDLPAVRAGGDNGFFQPGFGIDIAITSSRTGATQQRYIYTYGNDGIFRGDPGYRFTEDDTYIETLMATWPVSEVRARAFQTDQRTLENFRYADWMTASASSGGIAPTDKPVPLTFARENALLEFVVAGQNAEGWNIESLLIELHNTTGAEQAFWAYCELANGHAQLILPAGTQISSTENYMIGTMIVEGGSNNYTIIFPAMDITLQAGTRYVATLTPRGFYMDIFISIDGFAQGDGGLAVPFAPPTPDINGNFLLETPAQLITMSYMMRHYNDGSTFVWTTRDYIISDNLVMTPEAAALYHPIPQDIFTGTIKNTLGEDVTELPYGNGEMLQLFEQ